MALNANLSDWHNFAAAETSELAASNRNRFSATDDAPTLKRRSQAPGFAETTRIAGRLNASAISREEHEAFLAERAALLTKKYETSLSRREENRLAYVRWSLDRIEDAKHGSQLDVLEKAIHDYEGFLNEIRLLRHDIAALGAERDQT